MPVHGMRTVGEVFRLVHSDTADEVEGVGVPVVEVIAASVHLEPAAAAATAVHDGAGRQGWELGDVGAGLRPLTLIEALPHPPVVAPEVFIADGQRRVGAAAGSGQRPVSQLVDLVVDDAAATG